MFSQHELMFLQAAEARYGGYPPERRRVARRWWTRFGLVTGGRVRIRLKEEECDI